MTFNIKAIPEKFYNGRKKNAINVVINIFLVLHKAK